MFLSSVLLLSPLVLLLALLLLLLVFLLALLLLLLRLQLPSLVRLLIVTVAIVPVWDESGQVGLIGGLWALFGACRALSGVGSLSA